MHHQKVTLFSLGAALSLSCSSLYAGEATCPTLDLKTLPVAACAIEKNVYKTAPLSKISYIAKTPCPSQIGLKKLLQGVFKGAKEYPGTMINSTPGSFTCTYKLDEGWKKALNTTDNEVHLDGVLPTTQHVSYLNAPMVGFSCPSLKKDMVTALKGKQEIKYPSTKDPSFVYTVRARPVTPVAITSDPKKFLSNKFTGNDSNLSVLASPKAKITKDFEITCRYDHKTGGDKQELILVGSSRGNF